MRHLRAALARVRGFFTGHRADAELREELQSHLEMETAENIRRGMDPDEARRQALLASGGITQAVEAVHEQRGLPWLDGITADFKYALRALRRAPAFSLVVVVTLALGIGANTAIFSVIRGVLLRPLPHRDGDRLVYLRQSTDGPGGENLNFSVPEIRDFREGVPSLASLAEYSSWTIIFQEDGGAVRLNTGLVTGNYFEVMGLSPVLGRVTGPSDDGPGVPPVAVLTYAYWMTRFNGDSGILGRQLTLDKKSVTVIGVLQPAPFFPDRIDLFLNMVNSEHHLSATMVEGRTHRMTELVARLAPAATVEQARNEVDVVYARMRNQYTGAYNPASNFRVAVIPFSVVMGERARLTLFLLMAAAAFVLVISAANVANLTLMRGVRREHELAVRAALGAGVGRLRRLLLVENLLLAVLGGAVGVAIAVQGVGLLTAFAERFSPRASEIRLDAQVLGFTLGLSVVVALLLSFLAALPREGSVAAWILTGGHRTGGSVAKHRLQRALVVVQVAVSVVLLAGAGLLNRTMMSLADVHTGLRTEEVLTMQVQVLSFTDLAIPGADAQAKARYAQMASEIAALPGVLAAGVGSPAPLRASGVRLDVKAEGKALAPGEAPPYAEMRTADPTFFDGAGIPVLAGRPFAVTDGPAAAMVVIINRTLAERLFPNEDPVGRRVAWTGEILRFTPFSGDWRTVVGVTGNTQDGGLDAAPMPVMYMPFAQVPAFGGGLVIRTDSNAAALIPAAMRIVRRLAPTAPIENVMTISQYKHTSVSPRRLNATLISAFGGLALVIAGVGIAGVLAFSVSARTIEIGIRMSLGADSGQVQRMILKEGGMLVLIGLVVGVTGAFFAARVIQGLLFGVAPHDPVTFIAVVVTMALIGIVACWIPARRAARIDPAITMRSV
jgi:putative ABC transport system permease protein